MLMALASALGDRVPKSWAAVPWPQPINIDGFSTGCRKTKGRSQPLMAEFEGRTMSWIDLAIEAASGVPLKPGWQTVPQHCGDPLCQNPHHWVVIFDDSADPSQLPPAWKVGEGFIPQSRYRQ